VSELYDTDRAAWSEQQAAGGALAEISAILAWAGDHYPTRVNPPTELAWIGPNDVVALFEQCPSRIAHLALVDQRAICRHFSIPACRDAALAAWQRYR
jgi:hypothetical protein